MIVSDRSALLEICRRLAAIQAAPLPLYVAAAQGRVNLGIFMDPAAPWPGEAMERSPRPVVALVGDDPEVGCGQALGPEGWACSRRLRYWARSALVHGAGGAPDDYRAAASAAEVLGRVVMVETSSVMASAWRRLLAPLHPVVILPSSGVHPVLPPMGARH